MRRIFIGIMTLAMLLSMVACLPVSAEDADGYLKIGSVEYKTAEEIKTVTSHSGVVQDGDTIEVYGKVPLPLHITSTLVTIPNGYVWYLGKNNVKLVGKTDDATIYCPVDVNNPGSGTVNAGGTMGRQSTVLVMGDNISLENLNIMPNYNSAPSYAPSNVNKTIDAYGDNFTMKNCKLVRNSLNSVAETPNGGILCVVGNKTNILVEGCTFKEASISFTEMAAAASVLIKGNTFDTPRTATSSFVSTSTWSTPPALTMGKVTLEGNTFKNIPEDFKRVVLQRSQGEYVLFNNIVPEGRSIVDMVSFGNNVGSNAENSNSFDTLSTTSKISITENKKIYTVTCDADGKNVVKQELSGVVLDKDSLNVNKSATAALKATLDPETISGVTVAWSTSDASVATVNGGTVTAVAKGVATITATAGSFTASCVVSVNDVIESDGKTEVVITVSDVKVPEKGKVEITVPQDVADNTSKSDIITIPVPAESIISQLSDSTVKSVEVIINVPDNIASQADIIVPSDVFKKAKEEDKAIEFVVVNDQGDVAYSWTFDKVADDTIEVDLSINIFGADKSPINANIPDSSIVVQFKHSGNLPSNAKVKLYVGSYGFKFEDSLYFYFFNPKTDKLELVSTGCVVDKDRYAEVSINHCSEYVLSKNDLSASSDSSGENSEIRDNPNAGTGTPVLAIIAVFSFALAILVISLRHRKVI